TAMGPQIRRAFDLADHFRARGKKVVLGGTWVSLVPEESLRHADAVVAGEAEYVWRDVLADLAAGRSRGIYRAERWHDLTNLPGIDWWSLPLLKVDAFRASWLYRMYFFWPIFFSRGCPHPCEYCAVQTYYSRSFRTRPVDDVIEDVRQLRALGARRLLFLDDNPIARPEEAKELFRRLIAFKVQWVSQATINVARDPELLDLVARSGARVLSIGFESLSDESLAAVVRPLHMTAGQMLDGFRYVYSGFYSVRSMLRRFVPPPRRNLLETLAMVVANAKVNGYLRRNPEAWGTIS